MNESIELKDIAALDTTSAPWLLIACCLTLICFLTFATYIFRYLSKPKPVQEKIKIDVRAEAARLLAELQTLRQNFMNQKLQNGAEVCSEASRILRTFISLLKQIPAKSMTKSELAILKREQIDKMYEQYYLVQYAAKKTDHSDIINLLDQTIKEFTEWNSTIK